MGRSVGKWLIAGASAAHLIGYLNATYDHIVDTTWPDHARFHVFQAVLWLVALDAIAAGLALGPLARGQAWARWVLAVMFAGVHVGYFVALVVFPTGRPAPGMSAHAPLAGLAVLYVVGLTLCWRDRA